MLHMMCVGSYQQRYYRYKILNDILMTICCKILSMNQSNLLFIASLSQQLNIQSNMLTQVLVKDPGSPLAISHNINQIDRFLTFNTIFYNQESMLFVWLDKRRQGQEQNSQAWFVEHNKQNKQLFTIRHKQTSLYLTLTKRKSVDLYFVGLDKFTQDQRSVNQLWRIQAINNHHQKEVFTGEQNQQQGYTNIVACKLVKQSSINWELSSLTIQASVAKPTYTHLTNLINSFQGKIFTKDNAEYLIKIKQYASLNVPASQMQPCYLAYPQDIKDIGVMIKIAQTLGKKIVARSGGHQYSGLSSGGFDTILLSMDHFNTIKLNSDEIIEVGPCFSLFDLSNKLREWGVFVAHGVCPLVNVGGLGQTGGYGPIFRSFGLFIDFIIGFNIVLANGQCKRVNRPLSNAVIFNQQERFNLQLFRSVLGGNAGSFGIITKYIIKAKKITDHPNSYGFSYARLYSQALFRKMMKIQKQWTQIIVEEEDNQRFRGLSFQIATADIQIQQLNIKSHAIFLYGVYGDLQGLPYNNQLKYITNTFLDNLTEVQTLMNEYCQSWQGYYPLNQISSKFLFQLPQLTQSEHEVGLPYNRRCNVTTSPLNDNFIDKVANLITQTINNRDKSISFQILFVHTGGVYRDNGRITVDGLSVTSIPHRNIAHNFLFDLIYDLNAEPDAIKKAQQFQRKMEKIVNQNYNTPGQCEKKVFLASFGDLDMRKQSVINNYYDSIEDYRQLQKLKQKVDPSDIFHTVMTVKLPNQ